MTIFDHRTMMQHTAVQVRGDSGGLEKEGTE